jgi:putative ABC transport system permease protein
MNWMALQMLRNDKGKFLAMVCAVAMAVFLIQNQAGLLVSLFGMTASQIDDVTAADIWVSEPDVECFDQTKPVRDITLQQVRGVQGVEWAVPFLKTDTLARSANNKLSTVTILGVDEATLVGLPPTMKIGKAEVIREQDSVLIDASGYEVLFPGEPYIEGRKIRILDRSLTVRGITNAGAPFTGLPVIHASRTTAMALNKGEERMTTFVLVKAKPGQSLDELNQRIAEATGLRSRTTEQFANDSKAFYAAQGIPVLFVVTILIGLVVGAAITGQTFLMFVKDNSRHLAMLKAMGVTDRQMGGMLLIQVAFVLAIGMSLGTAVAVGITALTRASVFLRSVYLPLEVTVFSGVSVTIVTLLALVVSYREVRKMEPAAIFRT